MKTLLQLDLREFAEDTYSAAGSEGLSSGLHLLGQNQVVVWWVGALVHLGDLKEWEMQPNRFMYIEDDPSQHGWTAKLRGSKGSINLPLLPGSAQKTRVLEFLRGHFPELEETTGKNQYQDLDPAMLRPA